MALRFTEPLNAETSKVSTKPPRFVGAHFDEAFVSLELNFDSNVVP